LQSFLLQVEVSEIIIHKADEPNPVVGLFDADGLAGEDLTWLAAASVAAKAFAEGVAAD
jgi:hypothetical protein